MDVEDCRGLFTSPFTFIVRSGHARQREMNELRQNHSLGNENSVCRHTLSADDITLLCQVWFYKTEVVGCWDFHI